MKGNKREIQNLIEFLISNDRIEFKYRDFKNSLKLIKAGVIKKVLLKKDFTNLMKNQIYFLKS